MVRSGHPGVRSLTAGRDAYRIVHFMDDDGIAAILHRNHCTPVRSREIEKDSFQSLIDRAGGLIARQPFIWATIDQTQLPGV
jgi:hypothetical protein